MSASPIPAASRDKMLAAESMTRTLAEQIAGLAKPGDLIALWGDLGSGKTSFARGFITALTGETEVPSPTFSLVQTYDAPDFVIWHFDLYRVEQTRDVLELGFDDALNDDVLLVEWPERLGDLLPDDRLDLRFRMVAAGGRFVRLEGHGNWAERLNTLPS
ncbi:MAG: tRNA (adenosine(37)-N6)-threonylcarbamoyltransferase complex ATPase subunit type 1 TsaE [Pseudomonadota bacterium]